MSTLLDMNSHLTAVQILLSELHHDQSFLHFAAEFRRILQLNKAHHPGLIYFAGNGGSFSSSSHFATDINNLFEQGNISVGAVTSACTSQMSRISNDHGYDSVFTKDILRYGNAIRDLVTSVMEVHPIS